MKGADLKTLASVAEIARRDIDPKGARCRLSTSYRDGAVTAQYEGLSATATVWVERDARVSELEVEVEALRLADIASIFDARDDIELKMGGRSGITVVSARNKFLLGTFPSEGLAEIPELPRLAIVDGQALADEVSLASEFSSKSVAKPVLTGVRMQVKHGTVNLVAFDSLMLAFAGRVRGEGEGEEVMVVPARETGPCLKLLVGGAISILGSDGHSSYFAGESGWVRVIGYQVEGWPAGLISGLTIERERQVLNVSGAIIKTIADAVKALDADPWVQLRGRGDHVLIRTAAGETGQYATSIPGDYSGEVWYDSGSLAQAAKVGPELTLEIATGPYATLVRGKDRRVWLMPRLR